MSGVPLETWEQVGARVALARERSGFTQRELAERLGIHRSALTRIEQGTRRLDALQLVRLAEILGRTAEWFMTASPNAIASHRAELGSDQNAERLADELEKLYRDVELLLEIKALTLPVAALPSGVSNLEDAEAGALAARRIVDADGPIHDLQSAVEKAGLLAFSFSLGPAVVDGGYVRVQDVGIALVNGAADTGRRRFTLAHELGHHLLADEYTTDFGLGTSKADREALINAFAIYFLMPREPVVARWNELIEEHEDARSRLIVLAAEYRVSWSAVVTHAFTLGLISRPELDILRTQRPRSADHFWLRATFDEELKPKSFAPAYLQATVRAYRRGVIKVERAVELLHGTVDVEEFLPPPEFHIEELASEFDELGQ